MRTFRTYATARTYPLSAPNRALNTTNMHVSESQPRNSARGVLTQVLSRGTAHVARAAVRRSPEITDAAGGEGVAAMIGQHQEVEGV